MIKIYDQCNIFLLPSYIEGFQKLLMNLWQDKDQ